MESRKGISLDFYREHVDLDLPYNPKVNGVITERDYIASLDTVLFDLLRERPDMQHNDAPNEVSEKRAMIKALLTIRSPQPIDDSLLKHIDLMLQYEKVLRGIARVDDLENVQKKYGTTQFPIEFVLWRGDITQLDVDAIVNAANNQLLGCFHPHHACIDNAIHSATGPILREDCAVIMNLQDYAEPTGTAKITRAYHLPSKFVLHTVGPIIPNGTFVTNEQRKLLASCYTACLSVAAEIDSIRSVAFCGISTGVFGYPKEEAAVVAIEAVSTWIQSNPQRFKRIIFNVYGEEDLEAYERIFRNR